MRIASHIAELGCFGAVRSFRTDRRAVATIEFSFVLPVLLALFFGGFALSRGFYAMQKIDFIAHNLADLTARTTECGGSAASACLSASDVKDVFDAAGILLTPLPNADLKITVSEIGVFQSGVSRKVETIWSITKNGSLRECTAAPVLPEGFSAATAPLGAIIIVDVSYPFTPAPGFEDYSWTFKRSNYAVSRNLLPGSNASLPNGHIANNSGQGVNCK